jgi:hypothetical protein
VISAITVFAVAIASVTVSEIVLFSTAVLFAGIVFAVA